MMTTKHVLAPAIDPEVDSSEGEHVPEQQVQVWSTQILQTRVVASTEGPGAEGLHPPVLHRGVLQVLHGPLHPQTAGLAGGFLWTMRSTGVLTTWEIIWRGIMYFWILQQYHHRCVTRQRDKVQWRWQSRSQAGMQHSWHHQWCWHRVFLSTVRSQHWNIQQLTPYFEGLCFYI